MNTFKDVCKKTQKQLIPYLVSQLQTNGYTEVIQADGYIYAKGEIPILLTAHMDTVHKVQCSYINEYMVQDKHRLSSYQGIGGDDRCGIYMILELIKTHKCSVLFCEDEEIGGVGSKKFCESNFINDLSGMKYLIELDRANANDAVFYDCDNPEFTKFITENTGYKEAWGSFSDISYLAPKCKVAAVNLSCGYYNAHRTTEYVVWEEMINTIEVVKKLLDVECEQFEYIECKYPLGYHYGYGYNYGYNYRSQSKGNSTHSSYGSYSRYTDDDDFIYYILTVQYRQGDSTELKRDTVVGDSKNEAWGKFFIMRPDICYNDVYDYEFDYV